MIHEHDLILTIEHEETGLAARIKEQIKAYNRAVYREHYFTTSRVEIKGLPFTLALHNFDGELVAGLSAETAWDAMYIRDLWVAPAFQRQGIGSDLLRQAEAEAHERGCQFVWLQTFSFQARGFYEKLGYRIVGTLDDYPPGQAFYTMRKDLKD